MANSSASRQLAILYGVIACVELLSEFLRDSFPLLHYISKSLLMPVLLLYFRATWQGSLQDKAAILMQAALGLFLVGRCISYVKRRTLVHHRPCRLFDRTVVLCDFV